MNDKKKLFFGLNVLSNWGWILIAVISIVVASGAIFGDNTEEGNAQCFEVKNKFHDQGYELILLKRVGLDKHPYSVCSILFEIFRTIDSEHQGEFFILSKPVKEKDINHQFEKCWAREKADGFLGPLARMRFRSSFIFRNCSDLPYANIIRRKSNKKFRSTSFIPAHYDDDDYSLLFMVPEAFHTTSFVAGLLSTNIQRSIPVCHYLAAAEAGSKSGYSMTTKEFDQIYIENCLTRFALEI